MSPRAHIIVLGSGAGGGSPQWNCNCAICRRVRDDESGSLRRTQTSLAVSADGERWVLINASPDLGEQLRATPALHPKKPGRHSPIEAVVLTGAEVDQVTGLLTMRESEPFAVYASGATHAALDESPIFNALNRQIVPRRHLPSNERTDLTDHAGQTLDVTVESFPVPGKVPLYKEVPGETPVVGEVTENNVALRITVGEDFFFFIPGCAAITPDLCERVQGAPLMFFDGTLWRDNELIATGLGKKSGHRMGHVSISGRDGAIEQFSAADVKRKIFIHLNNSNPVLLPDTEERQAVEAAGWEVAHDGMTIEFDSLSPTS